MEYKGYFRIPRSLTRQELWLNLPPAYRDVFYIILDHACYRSYEFDDHGNLIMLEPGQFCASIREILKLCGRYGDKNVVERAIEKFVRYGYLRKEVRHVRMVLTVCHIDTYDLIYKPGETASETDLRQVGDTKKEYNKENKENTPPTPHCNSKRIKKGEWE